MNASTGLESFNSGAAARINREGHGVHGVSLFPPCTPCSPWLRYTTAFTMQMHHIYHQTSDGRKIDLMNQIAPRMVRTTDSYNPLSSCPSALRFFSHRMNSMLLSQVGLRGQCHRPDRTRGPASAGNATTPSYRTQRTGQTVK